jgi:cell division septal protein FtsQ
MSIFRKRSLLQSQKLLRHERVWREIKAIFAFAFFCGLLWGLSVLSCYSKLTVQTILVSGNSVVPTEDVLNISRTALQGRNFLILSRTNILLYPKQQIVDTLQYSYSWIETVSIDRVNLTTLAVKIKERVPVAVWCGVSQDKPTTCQLMDSQGYLFAKAPEFSGSVYLKLYGPLVSTSWRGAEFFSQGGINHLFELTKALSTIGFKPVAVAITSADTYDVFLNSGAYVSVKTTDPVQNIISNIDLLLSQKMFMQSQTSNFSNLLYIDARFGNKLFYKFK